MGLPPVEAWAGGAPGMGRTGAERLAREGASAAAAGRDAAARADLGGERRPDFESAPHEPATRALPPALPPAAEAAEPLCLGEARPPDLSSNCRHSSRASSSPSTRSPLACRPTPPSALPSAVCAATSPWRRGLFSRGPAAPCRTALRMTDSARACTSATRMPSPSSETLESASLESEALRGSTIEGGAACARALDGACAC